MKAKTIPAARFAARQKRKRPALPKIWNTTAVKRCRQVHGLTLEQASKGIGCLSRAYLHRIEAGTADPTLSVAMSIASFYGKTIEDLWPMQALEKNNGTAAR